MPDQKNPSTKTCLDKPLLRLSKLKSSGKNHSKRKNIKVFSNERKTKICPKIKDAASTRKQQISGDKKTVPNKLSSRKITYDILVTVNGGTHLDKAFANNPALLRLDDRDRRFVRLLATTCLRYRGQLEKVLTPMLARRPFGAQKNANLILLMGAAQLLFLRTGEHAAVDSTVELMRQAGFDQLCGLANAVMRRLTREGEELLAVTTAVDNLPEWLQRSWQHYWGDTATNTMARLAMLAPPLDISPFIVLPPPSEVVVTFLLLV